MNLYFHYINLIQNFIYYRNRMFLKWFFFLKKRPFFKSNFLYFYRFLVIVKKFHFNIFKLESLEKIFHRSSFLQHEGNWLKIFYRQSYVISEKNISGNISNDVVFVWWMSFPLFYFRNGEIIMKRKIIFYIFWKCLQHSFTILFFMCNNNTKHWK